MSSSRKAKALAFITSWVFALVMILPLTNVHVMAQATTGTLRGTVTDATGAIIPGATVRVKNQQTNIELAPVQSNDAGIYSIPNLNPGQYTITVEQTGFSRAQITDVTISIGQITTHDIALKPGQLTETVTITAGTDVEVQRDQAQVSQTFQPRQVAELPSNAAGGGLDTLLLNVPGVAQNSGGGTNTNGTGLSVNGNRGRSNNFQIDGSDNNDLSVGGPSLFIDNQDQVQEYQIITNNFSAQYGRNLGAVVNVVTKGGTNDFHGTGFEYHRDQRNLDSLNNIERAGGSKYPARFLSNVFGGTVGGPMILPHFGEGGKSYFSGKNKAFFFFSYEGIRQPQETLIESGSIGILGPDLARLDANNPGNPIIHAIATASAFALPLGNVAPRASKGPATQTSCLNPGAKTSTNPLGIVACGAAGAQGPFQLGGAFDVVRINNIYYQAAFIQRTVRTDYTQDEWSIRGDQKVTDKDSYYLRYLDQKSFNLNAGAGSNGWTWDLPAHAKNFGGSYIRTVSPRMSNEFKGIWQKINFFFGGCSAYGNIASAPGCVTTPNDINNQQIEAISFSASTAPALLNGASTSLRPINNNVGLPQGRTVDVWQFGDNLTYIRGRHSFILGAEWKHTKADVPFLPRFAGQFTYTNQAALLNNQPTQAIIALGNPVIDYTETDQYYFLQDDWKVRDNLTLNLGVRYEYNSQPINQLRDLQIARESNASTAFYNPALPVEQRVQAHIPTDKNNWAPRFGFAWTPRFKTGFLHTLAGEDATVIRGGYAIAYDPAFYNILLNVSNAAPNSLLANLTGTFSAQLGITSLSGQAVRDKALASGLLPKGLVDPKFLSQSFVSPNFYSPYSQQWSLGIQRQMGRNHVVEARYVGNRGIGLFQTIDLNPLVRNLVLGFSNSVCVGASAATCTNTTVNYPSFANLLPAGVTPQTAATCPDNPVTPQLNESAVALNRLQCRAQLSIRANTGRSWYDSLQIRYAGRLMNNNLSVTGAYTYGKTLDNTSEVFAFSSENTVISQNPFDYVAGEKGISNLHRRHLGSISFIYDVPYFKEQRGFMGHLLGGWQLNGNYVYNSGRPYTPSQTLSVNFIGVGSTYSTTTGNDALRAFIGSPSAPVNSVGISQVDAYRIGFIGNVTDINGFISMNALNTTGAVVPVTPSQVRFILNGPGAARIFGTPFGNVPRNYLRAIPINQFNFGLFKNIRVVERVKLQFRAEMYNAFNHPNAGFGVTRNTQLPDIQLEDAGTAFADNNQVAKARRVIQFGLRLIF